MQIVIQTWIVKSETSLSSVSPLTKHVLNNVFKVIHLEKNLGVKHSLDNPFKFNDDWILEDSHRHSIWIVIESTMDSAKNSNIGLLF